MYRILAPSILISLLSFLGCSESTPDTNQTIEVTALEDSPAWASEAVWYQIFPERFRNGDPSNDPTIEDIQGTYPKYIPPNWHVTPWTQEWYQEDDYMAGLENHTDFLENPINSFNMKVQLRRYGGDLQGVLDKLDYLDSLGINAIYFNPLNDAPSLHKYDARYWRHVDRNFGPNPRKDVATMKAEVNDDPTTWQFTEADMMLLTVIEECHKRDIRVVLDYSWNHTGHTFWAWEDVKENQEKSKYKEWYWVTSFDDPVTAENEFEYAGWFGVFDLPEIRETEFIDHSDGIRPAEGNIYNNDVKQLIFAITKRWLDPNNDGCTRDGVDGFRLDVAAELPFGFWREYRTFVRDINPNAYLLGEVWWETYPDHLLDPKPFLEGDVFDAVMNYRWYRAARHFFNASPDKISVSEFVDSLQSFSTPLQATHNYAMMNLTASHDAPRVLTSLNNKNKYKVDCSIYNEEYNTGKPSIETYNTLKQLLVQQFTYVGAPHIWAGDEMGMWGGDDPENRKPLMWYDLTFEEETTHPLRPKEHNDEVVFNTALFDYYKKLITIRKTNSALNNGKLEFITVDDTNDILAYSRYNAIQEVITVFNVSDHPQTITIPKKEDKAYHDVLHNLSITTGETTLTVVLPAHSSVILVSK